MTLMPRWFPQKGRRSSELFDLGKFFKDVEGGFETLSSYPSGLSIYSDEDKIYVEAHVPGLKSEDVEVTIDPNNFLWIKGEKKEEESNKKKKWYRQCQSTFSYCIPLWEEIDERAEPEAFCKEGVMKVVFSKKRAEQIAAKKIQVK